MIFQLSLRDKTLFAHRTAGAGAKKEVTIAIMLCFKCPRQSRKPIFLKNFLKPLDKLLHDVVI